MLSREAPQEEPHDDDDERFQQAEAAQARLQETLAQVTDKRSELASLLETEGVSYFKWRAVRYAQ